MASRNVIRRSGSGLLVMLLAGAAVGCATTGSFGESPQVITDSNGMTLYRFDKDERGSGKSACYGPCATVWSPVPAGQASGGEFGSLKRTDGTLQLTYDGWPVYNYSRDNASGDMKGDNRGGVWHALRSESTSRSTNRSERIGGGGY